MAAAATWAIAVALLTLRPEGWLTPVPFWAFWTVNMAGVDALQNVVLFAPLGWIAHRAGWPVWRAVLAGLFISACIEFAQQWVPGRTSTAMDLASNTSGAALGWWMATPAMRPRARAALSLGVLAILLGLHALNTTWPGDAEQAGGAGAWAQVARHPCDPAARPSTVCLTLPNRRMVGVTVVQIVGAEGKTYAHVQSPANGSALGRRDCVVTRFESTIGASMRFRPPVARACGLVAESDSMFEVRVHPRLEYTARGTWEPTRAGGWMWPVWPFESYRPAMLRVVGALTFVVGTSMLAAVAFWWIPASYLLMLSGAAVATGMSGPGLWELGWAMAGWLLAMAVVRLDGWWRDGRPSPEQISP